jgi:hypothetical protein
MANYVLEVPAKNVIPTSVINVGDTSIMIKSRYNNLSSLFKQFAETSKIDLPILVGVCYTLSGIGQFMGKSLGNSKGLMLWNRKFAPNFILTEFKLGRLSESEKDIFKKFNIKITKKGLSRPITEADQLNNEFNLLVGSIILGQLIDGIFNGSKDAYNWNQTSGVLRLDRIFALYMRAASYDQEYVIKPDIDAIRSDITKTPEEFIKLGKMNNSFWVTYVTNLIGKNGYLEITLNTLK